MVCPSKNVAFLKTKYRQNPFCSATLLSLKRFIKFKISTDFYGVDGPFSVETDLPTDFGNWFEAGSFLGFRAGDPNAHLEQCILIFQNITFQDKDSLIRKHLSF